MITAVIKNADEPSRVLSKKAVLPNLLPINAAEISEIINIIKPVTAIILGKTNTVITADINTQDAPFKINLLVCCSCGLSILPNNCPIRCLTDSTFLLIRSIKTAIMAIGVRIKIAVGLSIKM